MEPRKIINDLFKALKEDKQLKFYQFPDSEETHQIASSIEFLAKLPRTPLTDTQIFELKTNPNPLYSMRLSSLDEEDKETGKTLLILAAEKGEYEIVRLLISFEANIFIKDLRTQETIFEIASNSENKNMVLWDLFDYAFSKAIDLQNDILINELFEVFKSIEIHKSYVFFYCSLAVQAALAKGRMDIIEKFLQERVLNIKHIIDNLPHIDPSDSGILPLLELLISYLEKNPTIDHRQTLLKDAREYFNKLKSLNDIYEKVRIAEIDHLVIFPTVLLKLIAEYDIPLEAPETKCYSSGKQGKNQLLVAWNIYFSSKIFAAIHNQSLTPERRRMEVASQLNEVLDKGDINTFEIGGLLGEVEKPLALAVKKGYPDIVDAMLPSILSEYLQKEAFLLAMEGGHLEVVRTLIKYMGPNKQLDTDEQRSTLLSLAILKRNYDVIKTLLDCKSYPDGTYSGPMPLVSAVFCGDKKMVEILLEARANPNMKTSAGETPLTCAASGGHKEIVEMLLAADADPDQRLKGKTPKEIAHKAGHLDIENMFTLQSRVIRFFNGKSPPEKKKDPNNNRKRKCIIM